MRINRGGLSGVSLYEIPPRHVEQTNKLGEQPMDEKDNKQSEDDLRHTIERCKHTISLLEKRIATLEAESKRNNKLLGKQSNPPGSWHKKSDWYK